MIEKFEDLGLEPHNLLEEVEPKIQEKLGLTIQEMKEAISASVIENADELATEFVNIAPLGDYSKLLEDNEEMAEFLKTEAHKAEHWHLSGIRVLDEKKKILTFYFDNDSVDDGDLFKGFAYVSFEGKIKHAFAQGE